MTGPRLIVALDVPGEKQARPLWLGAVVAGAGPAERSKPTLYQACGPSLVERLAALGYDVFLDLKFHDIPTTVARAGERLPRPRARG